jgi:hypothetical protein
MWKLYSKCAERSSQTEEPRDLYFALANSCPPNIEDGESSQSSNPPPVTPTANPDRFSPSHQRCPRHVERKAMPNLKFLPSIRNSETITCPQCGHGQYPRNGTCIKCNAHLKLEYLPLPINSLLSSELNASKEHLALAIGTLLRRLRRRRGICQSQLTRRAGGCITRTSLSKAECGRMLLPLHKLLPLAKALGLTAVILRFEGPTTGAAHRSSKRR